MINIRKCAIIGTGFVGATSAFALLQDGLFSEIVLIDSNHKKAEGEAMDLNHGMAFTKPARVYAGSYEDIADAALVIIAAGANQRPGETRLDLAHRNIAVFRSVIAEIVRCNTECILLVVTNPVDVLTWATLQFSGFPADRVIGSGTVLDTARLKFLMGERLGVDSRNIHAYVIGEHGDTELPLWSMANVGGMDMADFCAGCGKCEDMGCLNEVFEDVRTSAYRIIEGKGATYYAVALAVQRISEAIVRNENSILTVSCLLQGQYGLDGVCIGVPAIVGSGGVSRVLDLKITEQELDGLRHSAEALKQYYPEIK